jgi:hypothetical protein
MSKLKKTGEGARATSTNDRLVLPSKGGLQLETILSESRHVYRLEQLDFIRIFKDALDRCPALGWEVVVIDFAERGNLYDLNHSGRERTLREYQKRKVLFFHTNVNTFADEGFLPIGRAHMEMAGYRTDTNIFVTHFDFEILSRIENPIIYSPYYMVGGWTEKAPPELEVIGGKVEEIQKALAELSSLYGRGTVNLVGACGTGKTTTLRALCELMDRADRPMLYRTLMAYGPKLEDQLRVVIDGPFNRPLMVLDEADVLTAPLHAQIEANFWLQLYASHQPLGHDVLGGGSFFHGSPVRLREIRIDT